MGVQKETDVWLREGYEKVQRLLAGGGEPARPHSHREAAREQLLKLRPRSEAQKAAVLLQLGAISLDMEQLTDGELHLDACLRVLEGHELRKDCVLVTLATLNHLGLLWSDRGLPQLAKTHLDRAEDLYTTFKNSKETPIDIDDLFIPRDASVTPNAFTSLEKTHTLTLYYLAQTYGALNNFLKSGVYCHITLKRQLMFDDYDPIDWALNSATLSQFFTEKNGFKQARHHLAAASHVLDVYRRRLSTEQSGTEAHNAKLETYSHRSADVARCWVKYGLILMSNSRDRLLHHTDDDGDDTSEFCTLYSDLAKLKLSESSSLTPDDLSQLNFPTLDLSEYEDKVTCKFLLTYEDAMPVFRSTKEWIDKALAYYSMETLASDHVEIVQDFSALYKHLVFFEEDEERQAKMHKRRVDLLGKIVAELNPTYYITHCRQLWCELAEAYTEILSIKVDRLKTLNERPSPRALHKINNCAEKGVEYYNKFLDSLKSPTTNEMPKKFTEDTERAALLAYFRIARLYVKMISFDKSCELNNAQAMLDNYNKFFDYCTANSTAGDSFKSELDICREMVKLVPFKIEKLKRELDIPVQAPEE